MALADGAIDAQGVGAGSGGSRADSRLEITAPSRRDLEWLVRPLLLAATLFSGLVVGVVVVFVLWRAWPIWSTEGIKFITTGGWDDQLQNAWNSNGQWFGVEALLVGTVLSTLGAVILTVIIGMGGAIFLAELAPQWLRRPTEIVIQLMSGIPSVVFGLVGLAVLVPIIMNAIPANSSDVMGDIPLDGTSLLAGVLVLTFMILPFFVTVAVDALRAVPRSYVDGGMALGMTRWRAITRLQVPSAAPGLIAGIVLATARGVGEAIALSMVAGSLAMIPTMAHGPFYFVLQPIRTIASAIVETGNDASDVPAIASALFALASILLVFSLALSLSARAAFGLYAKRANVMSDRKA